jgi:fatty acid desaturase
MDLRPASFYRRALKQHLPAAMRAPVPARLLWLPVHLAVVTVATIAIARHWLPTFAAPLLSLLIGMSFAGLMFLGHEVLHGAVVRGRWSWLRPLVGWVCLSPFALSQQLWVIWHNRVHHGNTSKPGADPDMYPTLDGYGSGRLRRFATDHFALGGRRMRGVLSLLFGFLGQSATMLVLARRDLGVTRRDFRRVIVETALAVLMWVAVAVAVGPLAFLLSFVVPLLVANVIVMSFILTNHALSPATEINDPLVNSLSVTTPRLLEWLTLGFGYHVEHHVFPAMSSRYARQVRAEIQQRWPESYQTMSIFTALRDLHLTGRVYADDTTLADPRTGGTWPTLTPRKTG